MRYNSLFLLIVSLLPLKESAALTAPSTLAIYGQDDRRDLYLVSPEIAERAASTLALFPKNGIRRAGGWAYLPLSHFGESESLCREEPFYDQPVGSFCSGSLVGPDLVLTAGHCVPTPRDCAETAFVFDFAVYQQNAVPAAVMESSVYACSEIVDIRYDGHYDNNDTDWALIRLDRPVTDRRYLPVNWSGRIDPGTPILAIGHPDGLPVKIGDGTVLDTSAPDYFAAELDTYAGSSGSPVFHAGTGLIEGIMIWGIPDDYVLNGNCYVSNRCTDASSCGPQGIMKISMVLPSLAREISLPLFP